jgi:putative ABC transport system ATP-binding protein
MSFIEIHNVNKKYSLGKTEINALNEIDLKISRGEYLCIIGPSGAGKSTLLNILGLIDRPCSGEIIFDNTPVHLLSDKNLHQFRKKRITFIFQSFNLIPVLNAYENIEFPLLLQRVSKEERKSRIEKITNKVGIDKYLKHKPEELSGGQRQRVAIARALVTEPEIVIADEPTANLDSATGTNILNLLKGLNKEKLTTFVIASHDPEVMKEADRVLKIIDGKIN